MQYVWMLKGDMGELTEEILGFSFISCKLFYFILSISFIAYIINDMTMLGI